MEVYNDAHVHYGHNADIDKENWKSNAETTFVMSTGSDHSGGNEIILGWSKHDPSIKAFWWFDNNSDIPDSVFGGKYHGAYTKKTINKDFHAQQLEQLKGKVLIVHCGMFLNGSIESHTSFRHALNIAENYPDIQVILAHMGGSTNPVIKKAIKHAKTDNVWFDTSGITNPLIIEYACNKFDENRILFGSDIPWCSLNAMLYNIVDADITDNQKEKILYSNMLQLL
ncbi:MAG: amidohydrolase family protein [Flavobacteriales bacterium]|nr:amidohydrolase family protein [Flavobacteriales bacterium]